MNFSLLSQSVSKLALNVTMKRTLQMRRVFPLPRLVGLANVHLTDSAHTSWFIVHSRQNRYWNPGSYVWWGITHRGCSNNRTPRPLIDVHRSQVESHVCIRDVHYVTWCMIRKQKIRSKIRPIIIITSIFTRALRARGPTTGRGLFWSENLHCNAWNTRTQYYIYSCAPSGKLYVLSFKFVWCLMWAAYVLCRRDSDSSGGMTGASEARKENLTTYIS